MLKLNRFIRVLLMLLFSCSSIVLTQTDERISYENLSSINPQYSISLKRTILLKVLLVEFKDVKHRNPSYPVGLSLPAYTFDDFNNMLFSEDKYYSPNMYSPDGKKVFGSLRDYYKVMSNDNLIIEGIILNRDKNNDNIPDWIELSHNKRYYHDNRGNEFRQESKAKAKDLGMDISTNDNVFLAIIYAGHIYRKWGNTLNPEAVQNEYLYTMGERFSPGSPYDEERDNINEKTYSHFSHIGIHVHEFCHLLGMPDLQGGCDNEEFCLMSSGNFNGPENSGACPAPINPYYRAIFGWIKIGTFYENYTEKLKYSLIKPAIIKLQDNSSLDFFLVEFRKFNGTMKIGKHEIPDYNSHIKKMQRKSGVLIWRKLCGDFVVLLHSCAEECKNVNHFLFPGKNNQKVISPWSDNRISGAGTFWVPNTKPSNNCAIDILKLEQDYCEIDFFQKRPQDSAPSKPKELINNTDQFVKIIWNENLEPDIEKYKIYKKTNNGNYKLYDSTIYNNFTDYNEEAIKIENGNYAFYKVSAIDEQNKESTLTSEVKIPIKGDFTSPVIDERNNKNEFALLQNYPNPFNPSTTIKFTLPSNTNNQNVKLIVYDIIGRKIATLFNAKQSNGSYEVIFDVTRYDNIASGIYIFRLTSEKFTKSVKGILMK